MSLLLVPVTAFGLAGCAGSQFDNGFSLFGHNPVDRGEVTDSFHRSCLRNTTPMFRRPTDDLAGRCECAATAFLNYGSEEEMGQLRLAWQRSGTGREFSNLVYQLSGEMYEAHCIEPETPVSKVAYVTLRGLTPPERHADEKIIIESATTGIPERPMPVGTFSAKAGVANSMTGTSSSLQLDPSALRDPDLVKFIQRKLESLGHFPGPIDGIIGTRTRTALKQYRIQQGIDAGVSDEEVMSTLIY